MSNDPEASTRLRPRQHPAAVSLTMEELVAARPPLRRSWHHAGDPRRPRRLYRLMAESPEDDKQSIFTAARHVQKADDYLHALQPQAAAPRRRRTGRRPHSTDRGSRKKAIAFTRRQ